MAIPATSLLSAYLKRLCSSRGHSVSRAVVLNDRSGRVKGMCGRNSGDLDEGGKLATNGERERATVFTFPPRSVEQGFGGVSAFFASGPGNWPICW